MTANSRQQFEKCFRQLEKHGLLLVSDSYFPSVYALIAGEDRKGSWWANTHAHTIFAVNELLEDHPDVILTKLISGKVTFVHRELWESVYSIGVAREEWQLRKLSSEAKSLLKTLDEVETLQADKLGKPAKELELRLLVYATQVHTESGAHSKILKTWDAWARDRFRARAQTPAKARKLIEERVAKLSDNRVLPWQSKHGLNG